MSMTHQQQNDIFHEISKRAMRGTVLLHVAGLQQGIDVSSVKPTGAQQDLWEVDGAHGTFYIAPQDIVALQVK